MLRPTYFAIKKRNNFRHSSQARNQDFMWGRGGGANETKVDQTTEMYFLSIFFLIGDK